ncbi:transmembrane protein 177-like [Haliotis rubra]|uniref:transmembrane protein 177-like n=1 Tax=Haliotis rubra TaxID=36100 RepID=UPI001EE52A50|nr:transmembrane protein 177-like [Haliotis rubra]
MALLAGVRRNMQYIAAVGAAVLYVGKVYPQVWGIRRYMEAVQLYKDGLPVPLDADSKRIGQEILNKLNMDPVSEASVRFFTVYGQNLLSKGSTSTRDGAIIGIPNNFTYKSTSEIERNKITLKNEAIDWHSDSGASLLESLIFSEKAKRFAIAREVISINTYHVHTQAILLSGFFSITYCAGFVFNKMTNFSKKVPIPARMVAYSFIGCIGVTLYLLGLDTYNNYTDRKIEKRTASLRRDYVEGGIEYYSQLLQRNVALRSLMKEEGPKIYTAYGNTVHTWRSPHMPLSAKERPSAGKAERS